MPQPYPKEFRDDVIQVALNQDSKTTIAQIAQIAKDFGIYEGILNKRIRQAEIDAGNKPGKSTAEAADSPAGAGERGPPPCCRVSVAGESAVNRLYPLVRELAADGIPVAVSEGEPPV